MLRFFYILAFVFCVFGLRAQSKKDSLARSEYNIYKYKPVPQDRMILEVNHTGWLGAPSGLQGTYTSGGVNFMFFFDHPIGSSHFSFAWGGGISSYNIHGPISLVYHQDSVTKNFAFTSVEKRTEPYNINRIGLKILEVPVEFRFRSRTDYQFKLSIGGKFGYVVQSFRKIFDKDENVKIFNIKGVNPWRYGVTFRVGWEQLHLTVFYSISEFFDSGKGTPGIHPFSIGLAYTPRITIGSK
jgi:hypothetical protein